MLLCDHCAATLRVLNLGGIPGVNDNDLEDIGGKLNQLEALNIRSCVRVSDAGLRHIAKLCGVKRRKALPPLAALDVGGLTRVSPEGLTTFLYSAAGPGLVDVDLRGLKIDETVVSALTTSCGALASVHLTLDTAPDPASALSNAITVLSDDKGVQVELFVRSSSMSGGGGGTGSSAAAAAAAAAVNAAAAAADSEAIAGRSFILDPASKTGYKGVRRETLTRWRAQCDVHPCRFHRLGTFTTDTSAARCYLVHACTEHDH